MADLTHLRNLIRVRAYFAVSDSAPRLQQELRSTSPRKTGNLISRTTVVPRGDTVTVRADTEYASYLRHGTRAGYLIPKVRKKGKYLAFYWPNDNRKVKRQLPDGRALVQQVRHPGIKSNDWWDSALRKWPGYIRDSLQRAPRR